MSFIPFIFVDTSGIKNPQEGPYDDPNLPPVNKTTNSSEGRDQPLNERQAYQAYDPVGSFYEMLERREKLNAKGGTGKISASLPANATVGQIMKPNPQSLDPDANLKAAFDLFDRFNFRHIPIATYNNQLVGILSERDAVRFLYHQPPANWQEFYQTPIRNVMTTPVLTVSEETLIQDVAELMGDHDIGSLPVIEYESHDDTPRLKGIVTKSDLYRLLIQE